MKKGSVSTDGFTLNYSIEGTGIPTIVIGSSLFYPRVFSQEIRNKLQLIFVDHRGFVQPPNREISNKDFELEHLLEDVDKIRNFLGLNQVLVMGHSGHAFMALEYSKKYSENVLGTVMIGVSPDYSEETHIKTEAFFEKTASEERKKQYYGAMNKLPQLIQENPEKRFVSFCLCNGAKNWYRHNFDAALFWNDVYTNMQMIDYVWGTIFRDIDITENLNKLSKPVLLMLGKYDYVTGPPELWDNVKNEFLDLRINVFQKSGHYPMYEEAEQFDLELAKWIDNKLRLQSQFKEIN